MREGLGAELGAQRNHAGRQVPTWESLLAEAGERQGSAGASALSLSRF